MARSRNIKPSFFTNDKLAEVHPLGRLLFQGLWCIADREGRLEDRPKRMKAELLPYDECDIDKLLFDLVRYDFIIRYEVDAHRYIQVVKFTKHQTPHHKEQVSAIPPHDSPGAKLVIASVLPETSTLPKQVQAQDKSETSPIRAVLIPDSLNLIPDSLQPPLSIRRKTEPPPGFDIFWKRYPRKLAKVQAERAFAKLKPDDILLARICRAIDAQRQSEQWQKDGGSFIPYPATWLSGRRWEDIVDIPAPTRKQAEI